MGTRVNSLGWPRWVWWSLVTFGVPMAAYSIAMSLGIVLGFEGTLGDAGAVFRPICTLTITGFGALLLARGRGSRAAALLGTILLSMATVAAAEPSRIMVPPDSPILIPLLLLLFVRSALMGICWPLFSLEISGGPRSQGQARLVYALAALFALMPAIPLSNVFRPGLASLSAALWLVITIGNQVLGYWILAKNYQGNDAAGRNRIKIVFFAFVFFLFSTLAQLGALFFGAAWAAPLAPGLSLAAAGLLAYAVLRRNLFDFNFALNRTLVYGTISLILLVAFGGAKWVIEHLIPPAWHESSEYYSFAIALALFLVLHRVHTWVERNVERVFFAPWHRNEQALRRFVAAAGHFERADVLCRAFVDEARRFANGAGAALYLRERSGGYALECGELDGALPRYDGDDLALAMMRAERRAVRLGDLQSALPGALALPMLDHGKLTGFILLDARSDGAVYRPDEVELLGWAAQQVGLDLQTMHVGELEAELAGLAAQLAVRDAQAAASRTRRRPRREAAA